MQLLNPRDVSLRAFSINDTTWVVVVHRPTGLSGTGFGSSLIHARGKATTELRIKLEHAVSDS